MSTVRVLVLSLTLAVFGAVLAGCAEPPPPVPDPLITCTSVAGSFSFTPPADGTPLDITADALPGTGLSGCTDHTGVGISGATLTGSMVLPDYRCVAEPRGTVIGEGSGRLDWSDGSTSQIDLTLLAGQGLALELTVTSGRWSGARATVPMIVTAFQGNCVPSSPATAGSVTSTGDLALHPADQPLAAPLTGMTQVDAGLGSHTCAVTSARTVLCWGGNSDGQLGNLLLAPGSSANVPVEATGLGDVIQVSTGWWHTCAVTAGGSVACWGANDSGQLGLPDLGYSTVPRFLPHLPPAVEVEAGGRFTCARLVDGSVVCWGANESGQLGDGGTSGRIHHDQVIGVTGATDLDAGAAHACVATGTDLVRCWGNNDTAQVGDGSTTDRLTAVPLGLVAEEVSAGGDHTCARRSDDTVLCWGDNRDGQLGPGWVTEDPILSPRQIDGVHLTGISAGNSHTCGSTPAGVGLCWGGNDHGQLGNGVTGEDVPTPAPPLDIRDSTEVVAGSDMTCALLPGGATKCWGLGLAGQLGNGRNVDLSVPVAVIRPF